MTDTTTAVTAAQVRYFRTFGFLRLRNVPEHQSGAAYGGRTTPGTNIRPEYCEALARALLGAVGPWHCEIPTVPHPQAGPAWHRAALDGGRTLRMVVTSRSCEHGEWSLGIIPGTHRRGTLWDRTSAQLAAPKKHFGLSPDEVPSVLLTLGPGDVIAYDPYSYHAFFGDGPARPWALLDCTAASEKGTVR
ncbi:hypothetical protein ABZ690_17205 [Streptomyces sp. NPDC006967]|uniref:hypothetical protein n=1 Tax=Streptomyces sp. NPDC006967 TaxID=3156906 RepID=UPI0033C3E556